MKFANSAYPHSHAQLFHDLIPEIYSQFALAAEKQVTGFFPLTP